MTVLKVVYIFLVSVGLGLVFGFVSQEKPLNTPNHKIQIRPLYMTPALFSSALHHQPLSTGQFTQQIAGAIVNHHLLASDFIVDTLAQAYRPNIDRIILLSPNHFSTGRGRLITTRGIFSTPLGPVEVDESVVDQLTKREIVVQDAEPFTTEHGIYNILPFLHVLYPRIPIIPVITKDKTPDQVLDSVAVQLERFITPRTLVVASLDFAHEQTNEGAEQLDQDSLRRLHELDGDTMRLNIGDEIQVDSPGTLRIFLHLMKFQNATTWTLLHHSNSALETGHLQATDVTSHITGLFSRFPIVIH